MQPVYGLLPSTTIDEVVPIGDDVSKGTAGMAEGHATIHAARGLFLDLLLVEGLVELLVILNPIRNGTLPGKGPLKIHEACNFTHNTA
jgi:hypothetical protein